MTHLFIKLKQYAHLARLDKPIGMLLLLWPTLWALWIAGQGRPNLKVAFIFIIGTFLMRSAGCVINDYADRHIDGEVARTKDRPLVKAQVTPREALGLFVILVLLAFTLVLILHSILVLKLAILAILITIIYPFSKRYFQAPQLILGIAFAWGIPMAFAAQSEQLSMLSWALFMATMLWVIAYDTVYAMVDRDDDRRLGVRSTAILFGDYDVWIITGLQLGSLIILCVLGWVLKLSQVYYLFLLVAGVLAIYQYTLIKNRQASRCFKAFLSNNWFGLVIFLGVVFGYV